MQRLVLTCGVLLCGAASLLAANPGEKIAAEAVRSGKKTIAVVPSVIYTNTEGEATVGEMGPRGKLLASALYDQLVAASQQGPYEGKFRVVPQRSMSVAMRTRGITVDNLSDPDKVRVLAQDVEADGVITLFRDEDINDEQEQTRRGEETPEQGPRADRVAADHLDVEVTDPEKSATIFTDSIVEPRTLATAAYQGESWEVRRWEEGKLKNVGVKDGVEPFGFGPEWEKIHYASLRTDLNHPYAAEGFPYHIDVYVGDEAREPKKVDTDFGAAYVVELNPGEVYKVGMRNDSKQPVYVALYIDGMSVIDQQQVDSSDLEIRRHWMLPPDSGRRFVRGWYEIQRDEQGKPTATQIFDEFKVAPKEESVAFGKGFTENLGMITAVFYTVGNDGVEDPGEPTNLVARGLPPSALGTGKGERKEQDLEKVRAKTRGLLLGAVTIYYRPQEVIEKPKSDEGEDFILIPGF